jgi:hypothetical protein
MLESLIPDLPLAALIAKKPMYYVIRLCIAGLAFGAAMNADKVVARVIGLVWLLLAGVGFLFLGVKEGTVVDILLGVAGLGAAGYSWWYTRT